MGGLLEAKKIAGIAEAHFSDSAPSHCGPIVGAANIQISACSPNFLILEYRTMGRVSGEGTERRSSGMTAM